MRAKPAQGIRAQRDVTRTAPIFQARIAAQICQNTNKTGLVAQNEGPEDAFWRIPRPPARSAPAAGSVIEQFLQFFQFVAQARIVRDFAFDLADVMEDCRVIPFAETAPDFMKRPCRQLLG